MNSISVFSDTFSQALAMTMIHSIWQGAVIVCVLFMLAKHQKNTTAKAQYVRHFAGLLVLFASSVWTFIFYYSSSIAPIEFSIPEALSSSETMHIAGDLSVSGGWEWQKVLAISWFAGTLLFIFKFLFSFLGLYHIKQTAFQATENWQKRFKLLQATMPSFRKVQLLISDRCVVPFVYGVLKPVVIIPAMYLTQLTDSEIESILLHELAHIRRHDFVMNLVSIVIESLLFFNPAVWWIAREMKTQREFCCDDTVRQKMGNRNTYLRALYKVAEMSLEKKPNYSVSLFHQNSELIMRIKRMLNTPVHRSSNIPLFVAGLGVFFFGLVFSINLAFGQKVEVEIAPAPNPVIATAPVITTKTNVEVTAPAIVTNLDVTVPEVEIATVRSIATAPVIATNVEIATAPVITTNVEIAPAIEIAPIAPNIQVTQPYLQTQRDTLPTSPRLEELRKQMEQLADEMEDLADEMEESIEENVEVEMEKLEELVEKLEEMQEDKMEELEKYENSEAMERLEALAEEMEEYMEGYEEAMEESFPEEEIEEITEKIEEKAEQMHEESLSEEDRKKLKAEMNALQEELQLSLRDYEKKISEIEQNPEMKRIQKEMEEVSKELHPMHELHEEMWTEEAKKIQQEMAVIQERMNVEVRSSNKALQEKMNQKAEQMAELAKEMEKEMARLKKKGKE